MDYCSDVASFEPTRGCSGATNQGCYDAFAIRCQEEQRHTNDLTPEAVRQWETVCLYLAREVFPTDDIALDVARHAPYLNSVNADSTWCSEIRQAYPHCLWCAR